MNIVAYDYSDTNQSEWLGLQIAGANGDNVSVYILSKVGPVSTILNTDVNFKEAKVAGIKGYKSKSFGTPDDSSHTETFVFEDNTRSYSVSYVTPPTGFFHPYSLEQAVINLSPIDFTPTKPIETPLLSPTPEPTAEPLPIGCLSNDPSFCTFTNQVNEALEKNQIDEIIRMSVTTDFECGNSEYTWPVCSGKTDGSTVPVYGIALIASEGGPLSEEDYISAIRSRYYDKSINNFQTSASNQDIGTIIYLDSEKKNALAFHSKKIEGEWKIDFLNAGVNLGIGGFTDSSKLFPD